LGDGSLRIFPVPDPAEGKDSASMLGQLSLAIEQLAQDSQFIVVDSITDLAGSCTEQNVIAFFSAGRRLTNQGKTVMMSIHNYVFSSDMFSRLRNLCDGYFTLNSEKVMGRPMRTLEINKINTIELVTENLVSFVVEPEIGMRVIPLSRSSNVTTILVVEDDQDIRFLLSETVSDLGYDVLEAADGGSGFRRAIEEHPDVILLDVMMPVMDGFQVLAKLKEHAETHPMPVIMVSARGQEQDIMRAMRGGAWGFVIKPWNQDDLESKINNAVEEVLQERGEL